MYTHFAKGFQDDGRLHPQFKRLMTRLADLGGWYVPTAELLDHLRSQRGIHMLLPEERAALERRWLAQRVQTRVRSGMRSLTRRLSA